MQYPGTLGILCLAGTLPGLGVEGLSKPGAGWGEGVARRRTLGGYLTPLVIPGLLTLRRTSHRDGGGQRRARWGAGLRPAAPPLACLPLLATPPLRSTSQSRAALTLPL